MPYQWPAKNDDDILDYTVDWTAVMDQGDGIITSTFTVSPSGLTLSNQSLSAIDNRATVWLSGGTVGQVYTITATITTSQGRTFQRLISIAVNNQ